MERIFPNLYRITDEPISRGRRFSYLLVREGGNVLIPSAGKGSVLPDHFDEIERLGGVEAQFINHSHDLSRAGLQEAVCDRFGVELHYHEAERKKVRTKTKCAAVEYGDEGLALGSDFRAIYYPGCTLGHSLFHWQDGGENFLFTSHVMKMAQGHWNISLKLATMPHLRGQMLELTKLPVDYALPTGASYGQEAFHRFNDHTRKSFATALRASVKRAVQPKG